MTWVTPETSRPRAATSVATSTSILPTRKARSARSREPWPRAPWTAATAKPRKSRSSATRSAARLVRVKIMVRPRHDLDLVQRGGAVGQLRGARRRAGTVVVVRVDRDGLAQEPPRERDDRLR